MKILLGISGSISAYKSIDLARTLVNQGHEVKIILTNGALKFVVPEVFLYLGVKEVYKSDDDFKHAGVLHVELGRWSDILVIAPLSANTLKRLSSGEAHDLLTSVFLAYEKNKNILVFPAMNAEMLSHPFVEYNFEELKKLKSLQNLFISSTNSGILACNDIGSGKLPDILEIIELIETYPLQKKNQKVVITTGATISALDPVRYLTNSSSGITGFFIAKNFLKAGFEVVVIAGRDSSKRLDLLIKHPNFKLLRTTTVDDMYEAVHKEIENSKIFISSAAVSDIEFNYTDGKVKKESLTDSLKIKSAKDILKSVIDKKWPHLFIVGFAAETDLSDTVLSKKLEKKPVDLLIGTKVHNGSHGNQVEGFNVDKAFYKIIKEHKTIFEGALEKQNLGEFILKNCEKHD